MIRLFKEEFIVTCFYMNAIISSVVVIHVDEHVEFLKMYILCGSHLFCKGLHSVSEST